MKSKTERAERYGKCRTEPENSKCREIDPGWALV